MALPSLCMTHAACSGRGARSSSSSGTRGWSLGVSTNSRFNMTAAADAVAVRVASSDKQKARKKKTTCISQHMRSQKHEPEAQSQFQDEKRKHQEGLARATLLPKKRPLNSQKGSFPRHCCPAPLTSQSNENEGRNLADLLLLGPWGPGALALRQRPSKVASSRSLQVLSKETEMRPPGLPSPSLASAGMRSGAGLPAGRSGLSRVGSGSELGKLTSLHSADTLTYLDLLSETLRDGPVVRRYAGNGTSHLGISASLGNGSMLCMENVKPAGVLVYEADG